MSYSFWDPPREGEEFHRFSTKQQQAALKGAANRALGPSGAFNWSRAPQPGYAGTTRNRGYRYNPNLAAMETQTTAITGVPSKWHSRRSGFYGEVAHPGGETTHFSGHTPRSQNSLIGQVHVRTEGINSSGRKCTLGEARCYPVENSTGRFNYTHFLTPTTRNNRHTAYQAGSQGAENARALARTFGNFAWQQKRGGKRTRRANRKSKKTRKSRQ